MTKEEKELLLKDICARLPYKICARQYYSIFEDDFIIEGIIGEQIYAAYNLKVSMTYPVEKVKPYLRPLSSMTKEEAKDIATLMGIKDIISINITEKYIDVIKDDGFCSTETITIWFNEIVSSIEIFDYLNVHCFDYRDLIPMELALPASEGMYN